MCWPIYHRNSCIMLGILSSARFPPSTISAESQRLCRPKAFDFDPFACPAVQGFKGLGFQSLRLKGLKLRG